MYIITRYLKKKAGLDYTISISQPFAFGQAYTVALQASSGCYSALDGLARDL